MLKIWSLLLTFIICTDIAARLPELIPYRKGNLWGYCDSTKKIVIEPQWEYASPFQGNSAVAKKGGFFGLINRDGKQISEFIYSFIEQDNRQGKRIVGRGKKKVKEGLIDELGREVISCKYTRIYWELFSSKYLRVEDGRAYGEMDASGRLIVPFDYSTTLQDQMFIFNYSAALGLFVFSKGSGYNFGVVDTNNRVIIPFVYDEVWGLEDGYFCAFDHKNARGFDTTYYFDRNGEPVLEKDVHHITSDIKYVPRLTGYEGNFFYTGWGAAMGFQMYHSDSLLYAGFFHQGLASFMTFDSLCGYVNDSFQVVIAPKYGWCGDFTSDSIALASVLHHTYPKKRYMKSKWYKRFDVERRKPLGYIDIHGTEYWED